MSDFNGTRGWRGRLGRLAGELVVVFVGVSAAFVVENYRDSRNQAAEFHQALIGVIAEMDDAEIGGRAHVDAIRRNISEWETADKSDKKAIPGYYRIPGAPHPPAAAWNTMVASGLARLIEPRLRTEPGYTTASLSAFTITTIVTTNLPSAKSCPGLFGTGRLLRTRWTSAAPVPCAHAATTPVCERSR